MSLSPRALVAIFFLALALRAGWGITRLVQSGPSLEFPDEQQYWLMAESLAAGDGLRDELGFAATRMPLYPAILAAFALIPGGEYAVRILHWTLGALAAVLAAKLGERVAGPRVGFIAGLIVAIDPFLIFFSSLLLTETPFITALLALWWLLARIITNGPTVGRFVTTGILAALCAYLRESSLLLVVLSFLLVAFHVRTRRAVGGVVCVVVAVVASLLPWAARNKHVTGSFTLLTHRGGISLYDGVRPGADGASDLGEIKQMPAVRGLNEVEWNKYFMEESLRLMREDPVRILRLAGVKLARTWNPVPNAQDYRSPAVRLIGAAWSIPLFALGLAGAVHLWRRASGSSLCLLLLPAAYLTVLHAFFVGSVRYRMPAMPMLAVLAAIALASFISRGRRDRDAAAPVR